MTIRSDQLRALIVYLDGLSHGCADDEVIKIMASDIRQVINHTRRLEEACKLSRSTIDEDPRGITSTTSRIREIVDGALDGIAPADTGCPNKDVILRNLQSKIDAIVNMERHDLERYGEWRCDYESWRREEQELFDARIRELEGEL